MNSDLFYGNIAVAALVGLSILAVVLAVNYFRKPTYKNQPEQKTVYGSLDFNKLPPPGATIEIQMQDKLTDQINKLIGELIEVRNELTTCTAERDNYKGLWEQAVERNKGVSAQLALKTRFLQEWIEGHKEVEQQRDEARALANDLREYLDRALGLIKIQNEQILQLMPKPKGWNLKAYPRDKHGRVMKVVEVITDCSSVSITPQPVKHLREVNAELAELQPIDWNVPQAFPKDYSIPRGTEVVVLLSEYVTVKRGYKGLVLGWFRDKAIVSFNELDLQRSIRTDFLAPINPTDHPLHPDFGKPKESIETLKEHRERLGLKAEEFYEPIEPRPDHPCLKGCSKPDGCDCPAFAPRKGRVKVQHPRSFFVEKGVLTKNVVSIKEDMRVVDEWAKSAGMILVSRNLSGESIFTFYRPAVNSDFDVCNTNF